MHIKSRALKQQADPQAALAPVVPARGFGSPSATSQTPAVLAHSFGRLKEPAGFEAPTVSRLQRKARGEEGENRSGMRDLLKSGIERLSGRDLSGVRLHRNSDKPARVQALAYTQDQNIHVGPGQERHLPHEDWHAMQQMQERVKPTIKAHGVAINDDSGLDRQADVMGAKALQMRREDQDSPNETTKPIATKETPSREGAIQREVIVNYPEIRDDSVVITAAGRVEDFEGGEDAKNKGWNGVTSYYGQVQVAGKTFTSNKYNNRFLTAAAGHVLAKQNGGDGTDPDNVFAQDGGSNNGVWRSGFENPMRNLLDNAKRADKVKFRVVLYGDEITNSNLEKESEDLDMGIPQSPGADDW